MRKKTPKIDSPKPPRGDGKNNPLKYEKKPTPPPKPPKKGK